ncbi:MAG: hypothetical protein OXU75_11585 [Deltaproteobacteria bacterium]|nr:hypothetical protein [Deltaproteobacteria bacterium]
MNDPVIIPRNVVARMPKALRIELGVESGRAEEVVAVTVPSGDAAEAARMMRLLTSSLTPEQKGVRSEERTQTLLAAMSDLHRPSNPEADLEMDNALLRKQYLERHRTLTSEQIRQASGLKTRNPSEPASRWKRQGKIFGVPVGRADRYPAFQFNEGRPRPEIGRVLAALPASMSPWQIAFWFASGNGWIANDAAPQDALDDMAGMLAAAADLATGDLG